MSHDVRTPPAPLTAAEVAERLEPERRRLVLSNELTAALSSAFTRAEVAQTVFSKGLVVFGADAGALVLTRADAPELVEIVEQFGYPEALIDAWRSFPLALETPITRTIRSGRPTWVASHAEALARFPAWAPAVITQPDRAWAALPLTVRGRTFGAVALTYYREPSFDPDYRQLIESVSERCAQALDRAQALDDARRRAAELEALLAAVPTPVFITRDPEARFIEANLAGRELFGLGDGENASLRRQPGDSPPFTTLRAGQPVPLDELPMQAAARHGVASHEVELDVIRRDGVLLHVIANARPVVDSDGRRHGAVGAFIDITERKRAEDALRAADRNKAEFLAVLSHELRNPLAPIRNSLAILDRAPHDSSAAQRAGAVLRRQVEHLTRLVDDLLDINRITHGKIELQRTTLDARLVAARTCEDLAALFEQRGVRLHVVDAPTPCWVFADRDRVSQMIGNLLTNALKFTPAGGAVTVSVAERQGTCEVTVRDTGRGIHPDDLAHIFEPFVQSSRTRHDAQGGMGIGLALARELATLQGGTVRASSEGSGRGAELVISLPAIPAPTTEAPGAPAPLADDTGLDIVIVEDNEDSGLSLADLLSVLGHRAQIASSGRAGIDAVIGARPAVLICDIGLPDLSGYDVIRELRALQPPLALYAIALTGFAQPEDRTAALAAGFDAHLRKPTPPEELDALLTAVSRGRARDR